MSFFNSNDIYSPEGTIHTHVPTVQVRADLPMNLMEQLPPPPSFQFRPTTFVLCHTKFY